MSKIKEWLGLGVPGGWDDVAIRTVKSAVVAFVGLLLKDGVANADWDVLLAAGSAAWVAGGTFALNAILTWAAKP